MTTWMVYILECADNSLYTGITNDLQRRLAAHENGTGAKYTRGRAPFVVLYQEPCSSRSDATKRELVIKGLSKTAKRALIHDSKTSILK